MADRDGATADEGITDATVDELAEDADMGPATRPELGKPSQAEGEDDAFPDHADDGASPAN